MLKTERADGNSFVYNFVSSIVPGVHFSIITRHCGEGVILEEDEGSPYENEKATEMTVSTVDLK